MAGPLPQPEPLARGKSKADGYREPREECTLCLSFLDMHRVDRVDKGDQGPLGMMRQCADRAQSVVQMDA